MNKQTRDPRILPLIAVITLLSTLALSACGPAAPYQEEQGQGLAAQDGEPTPSPTPGTYPNLDETLADLVRKYETNELTEEEAAALAPEHHGKKVLIQAEIDGNIANEDTSMEDQDISPRYADSEYRPPRIYALAKWTTGAEEWCTTDMNA